MENMVKSVFPSKVNEQTCSLQLSDSVCRVRSSGAQAGCNYSLLVKLTLLSDMISVLDTSLNKPGQLTEGQKDP